MIPTTRLTTQQGSYPAIYWIWLLYGEARKWQHLIAYWSILNLVTLRWSTQMTAPHSILIYRNQLEATRKHNSLHIHILSSTFIELKVIQLANSSIIWWYGNISDINVLILLTISKCKRISRISGNDCTCTSSRYQAISLLSHGLGMRLVVMYTESGCVYLLQVMYIRFLIVHDICYLGINFLLVSTLHELARLHAWTWGCELCWWIAKHNHFHSYLVDNAHSRPPPQCSTFLQ